MKIITLLFLLSFGILTASSAVAMDAEIRSLSNKVMQNVFERVIFEKGKHDELSGFDKKNLTMSDHQIYIVEYERETDASTADSYRPYGFALTILPLDDSIPHEWKDDGFEFAFPLLKIKFVGYQRWAINGRFDIQSAMQRYGQILLEYQQQHMPLHVSIAVEKESYKTNEDIVFTVTLTNASSQIMRVKPLTSDNLYILYDGTRFLTVMDALRGDQQHVMLDPGESLSKTFFGDAFQFAREVEIYASYNMTFEGVKPFSARKIKIYE